MVALGFIADGVMVFQSEICNLKSEMKARAHSSVG
jgi:hypothetical protein